MSFRETSAWIMFVTVAAAAAVFFGALAAGRVAGVATLQLMMVCVVAMIVAQVALHVAAAALTPPDARGPRDDRERAIEVRSHSVGYFVLTPLVAAMFLTGHLTLEAHVLLFHALAALVTSTLAIYVTQIILFRIGR